RSVSPTQRRLPVSRPSHWPAALSMKRCARVSTAPPAGVEPIAPRSRMPNALAREPRVSFVTVTIDGDIGVIVANNPPVKALSNALRSEVVAALDDVRRNAAIAGVVFTCAGRTFIAGADISEFGQPPQKPTTPDVIDAIEAMGKPVVAALFGTPMGGGFEVAL